MTQPLDPRSLGAIRPDAAAPARGDQPQTAPGATTEPGAAFRALLERLEERTRELEEKSQTLEDASGLAGAVDTARASLEDAVSLSDKLLEAFREARTQAPMRAGVRNDSTPGTTENRT